MLLPCCACIDLFQASDIQDTYHLASVFTSVLKSDSCKQISQGQKVLNVLVVVLKLRAGQLLPNIYYFCTVMEGATHFS